MKGRDYEGAKIFKVPMSGTGPLPQRVISLFQNSVEKVLLLDELNALYLRIEERDDVKGFIDQSLAGLNIEYKVTEGEIASIPREGPLVVVSNHPFGGVEGLVLGSLLLSIRKDTKIMANYLLGTIPELKDLLLCVDPFQRKGSVMANMRSLRVSVSWLKEGHVLTIFPAGAVSSLDFQRRGITDPEWSDTVVRIIRRSVAPVLPVYFEGVNSALFQIAGLIHPGLRTALLPHELLNKKNKEITVRIGRVLPYKRLETLTSDEDLLRHLRMRTYALRHRSIKPITKGGTMPFRKEIGAVSQEIVQAPAVESMRQEIDQLSRDHVLLESGEFRVMYAQAHEIPNLLFEIGRLRELTFRETGEGTGKAVDLDRFDLYYKHLFVWNTRENSLVGAYRMGQVDMIFSRFGKKGLYTSTLFDYKDDFLQRFLPCGLELGRSFVRKEYQKSYLPLLLLWKGIARFLVRNPTYTTLFGPASISDKYCPYSQQLMVGFLNTHHHAGEVAQLVRPRTPARAVERKGRKREFIAGIPGDIEDLSSLISDVENDRKGVPVLLRQYLKLGGKVIGFNRDTSFGNVLDGLIIVDLLKCDRRVLGRYMGETASADFLSYRHEPPRQGLAS